MRKEIRQSGIDVVGGIPWGTHLCQFYQTGDDLISILVPYFQAGLQNNEFCMWITSEPVGVHEAREALRKAVPDLDRYLDSGQIEIIPYDEWYTKGGHFDQQRVLDGWVHKLDGALARGHDGLRLTGNTFWLEKQDWQSFTDYERAVDSVIGQFRMIAICTYQAGKCGVAEVADVISNHQFALIKRHSGWEIIESAGRRRIEEALVATEARYRSLFENMPDGLGYHKVICDEENRPVDYIFMEVNNAFESQTGLRREDIIGKRITEVLPGIDKSEFDWIATYGKVALEGVEARFEQYSEPLKRWYSVGAYSPAPQHFVAVFTDTTEQVTSRRRIEELAAEAQRQAEVARQRAAELDAANKELEAFSYSVSHDLRAPLRGVDGLSLVLIEDYADKLDAQGLRYLRQVRAETQHMGRLIDDLLRLSRVARQEIHHELVNLSRLAGEVAADLQSRESERRVEFVISPALRAQGDRRLLRLVLENLMENAWKYTSKHPTARIEVGETIQHGSGAFFVRDDGAGFDMTYADKLFGAFQRLHGETEFPGSGIGLATVKRIIRRHGGQVWAESAVEQGATFYFTLRDEDRMRR